MPIRSEQFAILKSHLEKMYVPHLPKLLTPKSPQEDLNKNVDRSFAAFVVDHICLLDPKKAGGCIVDDFDDFGIDAVFYHSRMKTLYLVQAKLKSSSAFTQHEALAFAQGIRKLLRGDYAGFNQNVIAREAAIRSSVDHCDKIEIVVAHTGDGITAHAEKAMNDLLAEGSSLDARLGGAILNFDAARAVEALHSVNAVETVDCRVTLYNYGYASTPKTAFYGTMDLVKLAELHKSHGKALYQKNIRTWLGKNTPVNEAIRETLATNPARFQYLNNGVTALCQEISSKGGKATEQRDFELTGFSIINGAQTVASTANFIDENPTVSISDAKVMITLIKADAESDFGKEVTRARNTQNDVKEIAFAALDEEHERVRRELQHLGIVYVYRVGELTTPSSIHVAEAMQALALLEVDPRYPVLMKRSLPDFQRTDGEPYRQIFSQTLSSIRLANAVTVYRYIKRQITSSVRGSSHDEKRAYKHGEYALGFVFMKQFRNAICGDILIDEKKLQSVAGVDYDSTRQALWDEISSIATPGALAISKNQDRCSGVIRELMIKRYGLQTDPIISTLRSKSTVGQAYPVDLFKYLASKAPQIANIT